MKKIKCLKCGDVIKTNKSNVRVYCQCGACSINGLGDFVSIGGEPENVGLYNPKTKEFDAIEKCLKQGE